MKKIYTSLWFEKDSDTIVRNYIEIFKSGEIKSSTPMVVDFELMGERFIAINGGPMFKINPSISLFVTFDDEKAIEDCWSRLIDGGLALMPFTKYPWADKYGWVQDKNGLSWQLSMSVNHKFSQKVVPTLMFGGSKAGQAKEAMEFYCSVFSNSKINMALNYGAGEGDKPEFIKHAQFELDGALFMAMDSSIPHNFDFNEALSFVVDCEDQKEVDYYWDKFISGGGIESQCGWLKDKFGISWQIVPKALPKLLNDSDPVVAKYALEAMLKMKKIEIEKLTQ